MLLVISDLKLKLLILPEQLFVVSSSPENKLNLCRAEGKINNLTSKLEETPLEGSIGIGHTRWATHGNISVDNAHPHVSGHRRGRLSCKG